MINDSKSQSRLNGRGPFIKRRGIAGKSGRQGAILLMLAVLLPILFILSAFVINISYLQLSRTELMIATDAAARAGGRAFSHYQDVDDAKTAAQVTAALNNVGGAPLQISTDDSDDEIEFGKSSESETTGRYDFTNIPTAAVRSGGQTADAMRISGLLTDDSLNGKLRAIFPGMGLKETFNLGASAVAMQMDRDIALVLDRSGSMSYITFDWPSGVDPWDDDVMDAAVDDGILGIGSYSRRGRTYTYYYYTSGNNSTTYYQWAWEEYFELGTAPQMPWDDLVLAVDTFLNVLDQTDQNELVSLTTYASSASLDLDLTSDYDEIRDELDTRSPSGATAIGYGIQTGLPSLFEDSNARQFAAKTIIVMTDGVHNTGTSPITAAQSLVTQYNVTIHTVTFGAGADQELMQQLAALGSGIHYHAETGDELIDIFEEIANNLPTLITQ